MSKTRPKGEIFRRQERTFDRALDYLKQQPHRKGDAKFLDTVVDAIARDAKKPDLGVDPITRQVIETWILAGLQRSKRNHKGGATEFVQVRSPMRDLLVAHLAQGERATDEASRHMVREVRRVVVDNGLRAANILAFNQIFLYKLTEAVTKPREPGALSLHDVAVALVVDLAADLKKGGLDNEQRWRWITRIHRLTDGLIRTTRELAEAEAAVAGRERAALIGQGLDPEKQVEGQAPAGLTAKALADMAAQLQAAMQPLADLELGIAPDVASDPAPE